MDSKKFTLTEYQEPKPEKRSLLDRVFGESVGDTAKAIYKILALFAFVFLCGWISTSVGAAMFGEDTTGHNLVIVLGILGSSLLGRLAWVRKY